MPVKAGAVAIAIGAGLTLGSAEAAARPSDPGVVSYAVLGKGSVGNIVGAALLTIALQPVTGLLASIGRGYIAGLGWAVLAIAIAQILAVLGLGAAFPWAVPALVSGATGPDAAVPPASIVLVLGTGAAGLALAVAWWRRADHTG